MLRKPRISLPHPVNRLMTGRPMNAGELAVEAKCSSEATKHAPHPPPAAAETAENIPPDDMADWLNRPVSLPTSMPAFGDKFEPNYWKLDPDDKSSISADSESQTDQSLQNSDAGASFSPDISQIFVSTCNGSNGSENSGGTDLSAEGTTFEECALGADLIRIRGACVTMKGDTFVVSSKDAPIAASDEAVELRRRWLVEARRLDRAAEKLMRKTGVPRAMLRDDKRAAVGPEHYIPKSLPTDEKELYRDIHDVPVGRHIDDFYEQTVETRYLGKDKDPEPERPRPAHDLPSLRLHPIVEKNAVKMELEDLQPIQRAVIPLVQRGYGVIGVSPTGTGKTVSFLIPIVDNLLRRLGERRLGQAVDNPQALIMCPTRELAEQIQKAVAQLTFGTSLKCLALYGTIDTVYVRDKLRSGPDIVVATPGRMLEVIGNQWMRLSGIRYVVIDEVDKMIIGRSFPEVTAVLNSPAFPPIDRRQTLFFSATIGPLQLPTLTFHQYHPFLVQIGKTGPLTTIEHAFEKTRGYLEKEACLLKHLDLAEKQQKTAIVFVRAKNTVESLAVRLSGHHVAVLHGELPQAQREAELKKFRLKEVSILIATNVVSRGLDIPEVGLIINYDMPSNVQDYIHRVGRSGRKGHAGSAVTFYDPFRRSDKLGESIQLRSIAEALKANGIAVDPWVVEEANRAGMEESFAGARAISGMERDLADLGIFTGSYSKELDVVREKAFEDN